MELFNLNGQIVFTTQLAVSQTVLLPTHQVADGVYFVKFTMENGNHSIKQLIIHRN